MTDYLLKDIFLFVGSLIGYNHTSINIFHLLLVVAIVVLLARISTKFMQLVPHGIQNIFEAYLSAVTTLGTDAMGSRELARRYLPLVATLGLVIFTSNIMGMVPGFESPTANLNLTLALTICVFIYYHYQGIKVNGLGGYLKSLCSPIKIMAPFMFIIEIVSHLSRIVSLSFRLFGNI